MSTTGTTTKGNFYDKRISLSDGALVTLRFSGSHQSTFFVSDPPESSRRFFSRSIDEVLEFQQNDRGTATGLVLHLDGEDRHARRLPDRTELTLPVEVLGRYAGTYRFGPGVDVVITVEDNRLMAQPAGESKAQLYAEAEDRFFLKTFNAQVEFIKNKDAQITGLVFRQAGSEIKAPRR